jgi:hypothetical protein
MFQNVFLISHEDKDKICLLGQTEDPINFISNWVKRRGQFKVVMMNASTDDKGFQKVEGDIVFSEFNELFTIKAKPVKESQFHERISRDTYLSL